MEKKRLQRNEGNMQYNILTCAPLIIVALAIGGIVGLWYPEAASLVFGAAVIPMGCVYLWLIGALMKGRWYLEVDDDGLTYRAFMFRSHYSWKDIVSVRSEKTEGFVGKYDDNLVIEAPDKTMKFFLHNYGLTSKKPTVTFIEDVIEQWAKANPSTAKDVRARKKPSESDEEDVYDDEF